jgi:hypothetical protein
VVGQVLDRVTGRAARDALVLAALTGDTTEAPVVHVAGADSGGLYVLRYLNPGTYDLVGFLDRNRTRDIDPFETHRGVRIELGAADTVLDASSFTIMDPDTTPADLTRAEVAERTLLRLTFDDYLDPDAPLATVGATVQRADGQGPVAEVRLLQHEHNFVAVRRETARALADSIARADSVARAAARARAAAGDTLAADTTAAPPGPRPQPPPPVNFVGRAQNTDSTSLGVLGLTLPSRVIYAELADSLETAVDYVLRIQGVVNLAGLRSGVDSIRVTRAPPANAPRPPDR